MSLIETFALLEPARLLYFANIAAAAIVVCGVAILAERLMRRGPLPLRHLLLVSGLVALLATPLLIGMLDVAGVALIQISASPSESQESSRPMATLQPSRMPARVTPAETPELSDERPVSETLNREVNPVGNRAGSASVAAERALAPPAEPVSGQRLLVLGVTALLIVWFVGCVYQVARLARGFIRVRRLLLGVEPIDDPRIARIADEAARRLGMRRVPTLCQSAEIDAPLSLGVWRSRIVLPAGQVVEWSDSAWRALLVHELSHVQRYDLQLGLAQRVAVALYWWNPLVHQLSKQIAMLREQICDDLVTQCGSREDGYPALIVELASRVAGRVPFSTSLGAADGTPGELTERIRRLLEPQRTLVTSLSGRQKLALVAFCAGLLLGIGGTTVRWARAEEPRDTNAKPKALNGTLQKALTVVNEAQQNGDLQKRVRVVDLAGNPVVGAKVSVWAFRSAQGHGLWIAKENTRSEPPTVTTDAEGRASIPFPRYGNPIEKIPMDGLTCTVEHPDFATTRYNDVDVRPAALAEEAEIKIAPGSRVTITPQADGMELDRKRLFVTWSSPTDSYAVRETDDGKLELPRLPAGLELIRVVCLPEVGRALFSELLKVELVDGEDEQLAAPLRPGVSVAGRLDDRVSRPVTSGHVSAAICDVTSSALNNLDWRMRANIEPDGNFLFEDVPVDSDLQLIALCDGYMATSGEAPDFVPEQQRKSSTSFCTPQVFRIGEKSTEITLAMTPTVECAITVVDQLGKPIQGAKCSFGPNVKWWNGGSQIYGHPQYSTSEILLRQGYSVVRERILQPSPFQAITDEDGVARVKNLPPRSLAFAVSAEGYEVPIDGNSRSRRVDLRSGGRHELTITLQPSSPMRLGDLPQALLDACQIIGTSGVLVRPLPPVKGKQ